MRTFHRRTAPRVKRGKVQRKNRSAPTPNCYNTPQPRPVIDRRKPGFGYRHVLRKADIERFISLLPNWRRLSQGLNVILLDRGDGDCAGWHRPGVVAICAWERELWYETSAGWHGEHRCVLEQIGVPFESTDDGRMLLQWTESTVRAYQLTHILLHELGHHHDRMTTRSRRRACRGEDYAERYALQNSRLIWDRFLREFGLP